MLATLTLTRYRCFAQHEFAFRGNTVLVGANNAGKSTIIQALRLVAVVASRYRGFSWSSAPDWASDFVRRGSKGGRPSLENIGFDARTVIHQYQSAPAIIKATFSNGASVEILIGPPDPGTENRVNIFAMVTDPSGRPVKERGEANKFDLPVVAILPQPSPLLRVEPRRDDDYIRRKTETDLASRHFRNQIFRERETYPYFKELAESTWSDLQIKEFISWDRWDQQPLQLMIRDHDFVAEVGAMGHGLQMWLQTMWFLARHRNAPTVILDEPDVYMHPDLQRRLIRFVRRRHAQVMIATHSVEMMAEAAASEVLVISRRARHSRYADADPQVQRAIEAVGGVHNLQLARLFSSRRVLLVEGKDVALLRPLYDLISRDADVPLDDVPSMPVNGWSGWPLAVGSGLFLQNAVGEDIIAYALFDSDFHLPEEIQARYADAAARNVQVHVWVRKEIENYLVEPGVILRVITTRVAEGTVPPRISDVSGALKVIADELRGDVIEQFAEAFRLQNRQWNVGKCMRHARTLLGDRLDDTAGVLHRASGKLIISRVSAWSQTAYGVSLGPATLAAEIREQELDVEVRDVLRAVARGQKFTEPLCRGWWSS